MEAKEKRDGMGELWRGDQKRGQGLKCKKRKKPIKIKK